MAFVWSLGLILAAVFLPVIDEAVVTPSGTTLTGETLVQVNGPWVLIPVAVPAVICAVVAVALRRKWTRGETGSGRVAWVATGLLGAFALFAILSIGAFVVPVVLALAWAAAVTPPAAQAPAS